MIKFTVHFCVAVVILFVGVLLGMQQANKGLKQMKGYDDPSFQEVIRFSEDDKGEIAASIMGNTIKGEDLEEKKKKLEEMKTFNLFSELGKQLADGVRSGIKQLLNIADRLFHDNQ
ncbi:YqxA family protein [[Anoxybacillus] calidus]|jgi:DNA topoisomerase IA|nr:YqxA family protein [Anoxybacillus calidus]